MNNKQNNNEDNSNSESATQPGINPGQPSTPPTPQSKPEDVFNFTSPDCPLEQHESKPLPPTAPDQYRRLKEDSQRHGLNVPIVVCGGNDADRVSLSQNSDGATTETVTLESDFETTETKSSGDQSSTAWINFPSGKEYNIIYADPAWEYANKPGRRWVGNQYPLMSVADICALPVKDIAAPNCLLFMWVPFPLLPDAFRVIEAWGFKYKTNAFTWVKRNRKSDSLFMGCGYWTRSNAEICLLATKGQPQRVSRSVHSVIQTPIERHSKKPHVARSKIVQLCGDRPRIELFSRQVTPGWDAWGNEVGGGLPRKLGVLNSDRLAA